MGVYLPKADSGLFLYIWLLKNLDWFIGFGYRETFVEIWFGNLKNPIPYVVGFTIGMSIIDWDHTNMGWITKHHCLRIGLVIEAHSFGLGWPTWCASTPAVLWSSAWSLICSGRVFHPTVQHSAHLIKYKKAHSCSRLFDKSRDFESQA